MSFSESRTNVQKHFPCMRMKKKMTKEDELMWKIKSINICPSVSKICLVSQQ